MVKLVINNSVCNISGLNPKQFKELSNILSYEIDSNVAYHSHSWNTKRTLLGKRGDFPTGLLIYVNNYLKSQGLTYQEWDNRKRPIGQLGMFIFTSAITPYLEQIEAVEAALNYDRGTLSIVTAGGKTLTMALLVNRLQVKTLIVVPNLGLKHQLQESFKKWFGNLENITIENIDSPTLLKPDSYDLLIIDEAHHCAAKTYRKLNAKLWNEIYYRFYFTATFGRSKDEEQLLLESVTGQVIYKLDYKKAVAKKYITPIEAYYIEVSQQKVEGYTWREVYSELVVNNDIRNGIIEGILMRLQLEGKSTLCLVKEIAHGNKLKTYYAPFVKGENEDNTEVIDSFNSRNTKVLIGTTGVLGEGIDTRPAEYIIIAGLGKSKNQFMQNVGRGLRKYVGKDTCKIIIFKDTSHKWSLQHFKMQVKYLEEAYGVKPVKLEI